MKKFFITVPLLFLLAAGCTQSSTNQQTGQTKQKTSPPANVQQPPQASKPADKSSSQAQKEDATANWKTYRNDKYGLEFQYPSAWGEVSITQGNRTQEGELLCGAGSHIAVYGPADSIFLHDIELQFSKLPVERMIGGFRVLKYNPSKPVLSLCKEAENTINLEKDKKNFQKLPATETTGRVTRATFTNSAGVKVLYYPNWLGGAGSNVDQFYKMYGNGIEVEGGLQYAPVAYTPEANEMGEYNKICDASRNCVGVIKWAKEGKSSAKIRTAFDTFDKVVRTFKFTK